MHDEDAASNPLSDEHLPVGGEIDDEDDGIAPDISDDYTTKHDDEDTGLSSAYDDDDEDELSGPEDTELEDEEDEAFKERF